MYKFIAADVDGTLLNSKKEIPPNTLHALKTAQQEGVKLIIATGRPPYGVRSIAKALELDRYGGYIIGCNGAVVVSANDTNVPLYSSDFPLECLPDLCRMLKGQNVGISTYEGNSIVVGNCLTEYIVRNAEMLGMPFKFVPDFSDHVDFPVYKCLLSGSPEIIIKLEKLLSEKFSHRLSVFRSEKFLLEMVKSGVSKGAALDLIISGAGAKPENCIAFGDNDNDISMIRYAGLGVAMGNASPKAMAAADIVALSNDNEGIAALLKKIYKKS